MLRRFWNWLRAEHYTGEWADPRTEAQVMMRFAEPPDAVHPHIYAEPMEWPEGFVSGKPNDDDWRQVGRQWRFDG